MYPQAELNRLAADKAALIRRLATNRGQCVAAVCHLGQPLVWLDRVLILWRRFIPPGLLVALPLGLLLKRSSSLHPRLLGAILRWGPLLLGVLRGLQRPPARQG